MRFLICCCILSLFTESLAARTECPSISQPRLWADLRALVNLGRADDVLDCIRQIKENQTTVSYADEFNYNIAFLMTEAIEKLSRGGKLKRSDARDAADLWEAYLDSVSEPFNTDQLNFALARVVEYGRYENFPDRLPGIVKGIGKVKSGIRFDVANDLFSTIKRCPTWGRKSPRLACETACVLTAAETIRLLESELGELPWSGARGLSRLSVNANVLARELSECKL